MSKVTMERLLQYSSRIETDIMTGGCPAARLFLGDKLCVSDHLIVAPDGFDDATTITYDVMHKLRMDVVIRRARNKGESGWDWKPKHYERVSLFFYHPDFDELLEYAANWLDVHYDTETGLYAISQDSEIRRGYFVRTINYPQIGRIRHYTNPLPVGE